MKKKKNTHNMLIYYYKTKDIIQNYPILQPLINLVSRTTNCYRTNHLSQLQRLEQLETRWSLNMIIIVLILYSMLSSSLLRDSWLSCISLLMLRMSRRGQLICLIIRLCIMLLVINSISIRIRKRGVLLRLSKGMKNNNNNNRNNFRKKKQ